MEGWQFWSARGMRFFDRLLVVYVVVWLVIGVLIGLEIRRQAELSDQVTRVGAALTDVGQSLQVVGGLPLVGGNIGRLADRVLQAAGEVKGSGQDSRQSLERMGILVGAAFVLVPIMLVLPVYLPLRLTWRREVAAVAAALRADRDPATLDQLLARRALAAMSYTRLLATDHPRLGELSAQEGRVLSPAEARVLADVELERLGLTREATQ